MATKTLIKLSGLELLDLELGLRGLISERETHIATIHGQAATDESVRLNRERALLEKLLQLDFRGQADLIGESRAAYLERVRA
jgi:hypothetical protein